MTWVGPICRTCVETWTASVGVVGPPTGVGAGAGSVDLGEDERGPWFEYRWVCLQDTRSACEVALKLFSNSKSNRFERCGDAGCGSPWVCSLLSLSLSASSHTHTHTHIFPDNSQRGACRRLPLWCALRFLPVCGRGSLAAGAMVMFTSLRVVSAMEVDKSTPMHRATYLISTEYTDVITGRRLSHLATTVPHVRGQLRPRVFLCVPICGAVLVFALP